MYCILMRSVHQSVITIAALVLQTGEIVKCGPISDCYSCPCIVKQWSLGSMCQLVTAIALPVLHIGKLGKCVPNW